MSARAAIGLALAGLCVCAQALPLFGGHHRAAGGAPPLPPDRLTVSGAILDPAAPGDAGALNLELIGDVVLGTAPDHAGYTACAGRCQIAPPLRSRALVVGAESRLVLAAGWAAPSGASLDLDASSIVQVRGALSGALSVSVAGVPPTLPVLLLSATSITASITAGALPPGTRLSVTTTSLYLESIP